MNSHQNHNYKSNQFNTNHNKANIHVNNYPKRKLNNIDPQLKYWFCELCKKKDCQTLFEWSYTPLLNGILKQLQLKLVQTLTEQTPTDTKLKSHQTAFQTSKKRFEKRVCVSNNKFHKNIQRVNVTQAMGKNE